MSISTESMYQQIILDHYKHPQHHQALDTFDAEVHHVNPTCGDEVTLRVKVVDGQLADLGWTGEGCSISQASTSVMSDLVIGERIQRALELQETFLSLMQSQGQETLTDEQTDELEDAIAFAGVSKYPARVKCALLGWMAMKSAVAQALADPRLAEPRVADPRLAREAAAEDRSTPGGASGGSQVVTPEAVSEPAGGFDV